VVVEVFDVVTVALARVEVVGLEQLRVVATDAARVDPALEAELVLTRADISDLGIEPARANQVTTLLAEYHSSRIDAFQLSYRLGNVLTPAEMFEVLKVNGVVDRRRPE